MFGEGASSGTSAYVCVHWLLICRIFILIFSNEYVNNTIWDLMFIDRQVRLFCASLCRKCLSGSDGPEYRYVLVWSYFQRLCCSFYRHLFSCSKIYRLCIFFRWSNTIPFSCVLVFPWLACMSKRFFSAGGCINLLVRSPQLLMVFPRPFLPVACYFF